MRIQSKNNSYQEELQVGFQLRIQQLNQNLMEPIQLNATFMEGNSLLADIRASLSSQSPLLFGNYKLNKVIGRGAFATVYLAKNNDTGRKVALKIVDLSELAIQYESESIQRKIIKSLADEEKHMKLCHSAHVIKIYESFDNGKNKVYALEFCNQGNLENYLKKKGAFSEKDAISFIKQIICGLAELHSNNIVHRDLKPANILIHNGIVKIADLGFSKTIPEGTYNHTCLGTKSTMAPQVANQEPYGLKADIWSIGVILFLMMQYDTDLNFYQNTRKIERFMEDKTNFKSKMMVEKSMSLEVRDFLTRTIEVDQTKRMDWEQTLSHPMFAKKQEGLHDFFVPGLEKTFQQIKLHRASSEREDLNPEDKDIQQVVNNYYLDCMKAELILNEIIVPLQNNPAISLNNKKHLELMILLANRCKTNIDFALLSVQNLCKQNFFTSFKSELQLLKDKVEMKYNHLSERLHRKESSIYSIVTDKVKKIIGSKDYEEKEKFVNGIERMDFTRTQQIDFTFYTYIDPFLNLFQGKSKSYASRYRQLMWIESEDIEENRFSHQVQQIIEKH